MGHNDISYRPNYYMDGEPPHSLRNILESDQELFVIMNRVGEAYN